MAEISLATGTAASSGDNTLVAAPGSGMRTVVTAIIVQEESGTATTMIVKQGSTAKVRFLGQNQGDGLAWRFPAGRPWKLPDNAVLVLNLSGANQVGYTVEYYQEAT